MKQIRNVIIINDHAFVSGGQAKVAIESALMLAAAGLQVTFFAGVGPVDSRLETTGVRSVCLGQRDLLDNPNRVQAATTGLWNREAARQLSALLGEYDAGDSIIHIHGWAKSLSPSIGPAIFSSGLAHVYTLHEYFLACPTGGFYDGQRQEICTRRPLGISCLTTHCDRRRRIHKAWRVLRQAILWSAGAMPRSLRDFIYLSQIQFDAMRPYLPADARMHHLPNAVERPEATRIAAEDNETFLFIGRLSAEKGAEMAARAARDAGVPIAFAGEGECREAIIAANPQALMLGWQDAAALAATMRKARCLVFPSLWYEGYPMVVLEAMRMGLPVLTSDRTAATEMVRHGQDGLHVETGNQSAWAQAMLRMADPCQVARYSASSLEAAQGFISIDAYCTRLIAIYEQAAYAQHGEHVQRMEHAHVL